MIVQGGQFFLASLLYLASCLNCMAIPASQLSIEDEPQEGTKSQ